MKTRFAHKVLAAFGLAVLPLINGCTQQSAGNSPAYVTTSSVAPPIVHVAPAGTTLPSHPAPVVPEISNQVAQATGESVAAAPVVLPEKLRISQPLSEVIRLAQSGVDEGVILTYITNSAAMFTLGAEEIVYLNDLGVNSIIITALMQRDQGLKKAAAAAPPIAVAPTYVNPPQPVVVQESQPTYVTENYFHDSLSPYGTWIEVEGYGRCWRPTVAITGPMWRPYVDRGHWVHTDAGWYWMSDYSWGSVAFHYGRWFSHPRMGWCWWPDNVWAPSWVSWRYDNDHCGWAPLPPLSYYRAGSGFYYRDRNVGFSFDFGIGVDAFTFVQWGRFCDPRPYQYCLPRNRVNTVYNQTTIINNYGDGNNNTVINRGISTDRVREHSRGEIRTVSIRDERPRKGEVRSERLESGGRTLVVPRPILRPLSPLPGVGRIGSPLEKSDARVYSITPAAATPPAVQLTPTGTRENRPESKSGRERTVTAPAAIKPPVVAAPQVNNNYSGRSERESKVEKKSSERNQSIQVVAPATPARITTPIFSKPIVVETAPHAPSRPVVTPSQNSTTVIGDGRNRSANRDYSVWNTPKVQPAPTTQPAPTASAPEYNNRSSSRNQSVRESAPQVEAVQGIQPSRPAAADYRPQNNSRIEQRLERESRAISVERESRSRSEGRSVAPAISTPSPLKSPAAPAFTPTPTPVARPSSPAFTPPPAPRVESQPAPSRSEPSRSETRSEARGESRSDSNRPKRDR
jgi:hypothetical protein